MPKIKRIRYTPNKNKNFQCKYYAKPLKLDEAITEIGKLIYYSYSGTYTVPKKYYFVSPKGVTNQLLNCLMDTAKLKDELMKRWDKQCKPKITKKGPVELDKELLSHINSYVDFGIFDHIPTLEIIELHSKTPFHAVRFGSSARKRPKPIAPPKTPATKELTYNYTWACNHTAKSYHGCWDSLKSI